MTLHHNSPKISSFSSLRVRIPPYGFNIMNEMIRYHVWETKAQKSQKGSVSLGSGLSSSEAWSVLAQLKAVFLKMPNVASP